MNGIWKDFTNGIIRENPVLRLMIGLCPLLAVSNTAINGFGMGVATFFVLVFSNIVVSMIRKFVPNQVRIPVFIIIISTFVTITDLVMAAFAPELHRNLGVFVPLIVVNCIILGRAEAFAYRKPVLNSLADGLGMGLGFTLIITLIGVIRELLGSGQIFGWTVLGAWFEPAIVMILPPGAFLTIGFLMGLLNKLEKKSA